MTQEVPRTESVSRDDLEALAEAVHKQLVSIEKETISREEFEALKYMLSDIQRRLKDPKELKLEVYRCHEGKCDFVTQDLVAFIEHTVDMHVEKLSEEKTKPFHPTVKEYLECPECYPKFRDALMKDPRFLELLKADGWVKEEEKPKRKGFLH